MVDNLEILEPAVVSLIYTFNLGFIWTWGKLVTKYLMTIFRYLIHAGAAGGAISVKVAQAPRERQSSDCASVLEHKYSLHKRYLKTRKVLPKLFRVGAAQSRPGRPGPSDMQGWARPAPWLWQTPFSQGLACAPGSLRKTLPFPARVCLIVLTSVGCRFLVIRSRRQRVWR